MQKGIRLRRGLYSVVLQFSTLSHVIARGIEVGLGRPCLLSADLVVGTRPTRPSTAHGERPSSACENLTSCVSLYGW